MALQPGSQLAGDDLLPDPGAGSGLSLLHGKESPAGLQRPGDEEAKGGRAVASAAEWGTAAGGRIPGKQLESLVALPGGPCVAGGDLFPNPGTGQRLSGVRRSGEAEGPAPDPEKGKSPQDGGQPSPGLNAKKRKERKKMKFMKKNGGFTLVELIVVIAILAILAGVAVPAYSGYVEKANEAGDQTLLASVNTAFAAACNFNGEDNYNRKDNPSFDVSTGVLTTGNNKINESFAELYEGGEFKVFTSLYYNGQLGIFKDLAGNVFHKVFGALDLSDYVTDVNDSTFGAIGAEGLMLRVDDVTGLAEALLGTNAGNALKGALSQDIEIIAKSMGMTASELEALIDGQENSAAYYNNLLSNYAVLQVANTTANKNTSDLLADLKSGMTTTDISNMIASNDTTSSKEGVAKAAMMYAMYTAYANQLEDGAEKTAALNNLKDMDTFVTAIGTETQAGSGFMNYLDDDQATTDMDGFLASMNIITNSTKNDTEATRDLLENGYNNSDLIGALQGLLGN